VTTAESHMPQLGLQEPAAPRPQDGAALIQVAQLAKRFGEIVAVDGISFDVRAGELLGFLGPNGAGKTTTINMMTGLARPDSGDIRIGGLDCIRAPKAAQHLVGVVPDESNLYPELTGFDNLCFCAALYGMRKEERRLRARELLAAFGLSEAADRKFEAYSKGMKRRLTMAAGIIHRPRILFLDEPTTGVDVASARHIRQLIAQLHRTGTTILLTTHYIEEAERLCERIVFIVGGRIVRIDTVANLLHPAREGHSMLVSLSRAGPALCAGLARAFPGFAFELVSDTELRVGSAAPIRVGPLVRFLEDQGAEVTEARLVHPSLEDVFVRVTGIEVDALRKEKERAEAGV
jgi:ABC-2 type transport system ATP-binding protein